MKVRTTLVLLAVLILSVITILLLEYWPEEREKGAEKLLFANLSREAVQTIEIKTPSAFTSLKLRDGVWRVASAGDYPAGASDVEKILEKVPSFERTDVASKNPEKRALFQVDQSGTEVKLYEAGETPVAHFFVGKAGQGMSTFVRVEGGKEVYRIPEDLRSVFDKGTRGWRDRAIFQLNADDFVAFTSTSPSGTVKLAKDDEGNWKLVQPEEAPAKSNVVLNMCRIFAGLEADAWAEGTDLEAFGLSAPEIRIEAVLIDGSRPVLLAGNMNDEKKQQYVMREGSDTVFLISEWRIKSFTRPVESLKEQSPALPPPAP